jgi:hypothetical protein
MADFTRLMERSWRKGWALVALDLGVDTTTPAGEMIANSVANFSQFERLVIGQRTKDALAVRKAQGVRLGRPRTMPVKVVRRIERLRAKGPGPDGRAHGVAVAWSVGSPATPRGVRDGAGTKDAASARHLRSGGSTDRTATRHAASLRDGPVHLRGRRIRFLAGFLAGVVAHADRAERQHVCRHRPRPLLTV